MHLWLSIFVGVWLHVGVLDGSLQGGSFWLI